MISKLIDQIDIENLYQHVLQIEGVKHPLNGLAKLNQAADYIHTQMKSFGLSVCEQTFQLDGWKDTFRNIEGSAGPEDKPAIVLIGHYDTVDNSPGAIDNGSSIAVILEIARLIAMLPDPPALRFVAATLEEGNPVFESRLQQKAMGLGLIDDQQRYTSHETSRAVRGYLEMVSNLNFSGMSIAEAIEETLSQIGGQLSEKVHEYIALHKELYSSLTTVSSIGTSGRIGSSMWVREAVDLGKKIRYYICMDEIGVVLKHRKSQRSFPGVALADLPSYKVDADNAVGDFLFVGANPQSPITQSFCSHCKDESIDLPYAMLPIPGTFEEIVDQTPKALDSDHAAFMKAGIQGLFLSDLAGLRLRYGHTPADTIDKLDFDHLAHISKAVMATILDTSLT